MKGPQFLQLVLLIVFSSAMLVVGLYLLAKFNRLFRRQIENESLRRNFAVWLIALCLVMSVLPTTPDFYNSFANHKLLHFFLLTCFGVTLEALFVFNISWYVVRRLEKSSLSFKTKMTIILITIVGCTMLTSVPLNFLGNRVLGKGGSFENLQYTVLFNFYTGCMTGLIYITMTYVNLDRQRKLNEKELEVARLQGLKTKAELDALHSKINPHFLYNALNSIADLSVTDGRKARKMTIALADLFRYSMNYSDRNYSTVQEEIEMTEVYMAIEKIRFEDQLSYSISLGENVNHFLVPRFLLQPVVENAVKHGLKATGKLTVIHIEIHRMKEGLQISVADNGPDFPEELVPGYGVKSIYDKLDLLFPDNYEIHFTNEPEKKVLINIHKLVKNEPVV